MSNIYKTTAIFVFVLIVAAQVADSFCIKSGQEQLREPYDFRQFPELFYP